MTKGHTVRALLMIPKSIQKATRIFKDSKKDKSTNKGRSKDKDDPSGGTR